MPWEWFCKVGDDEMFLTMFQTDADVLLWIQDVCVNPLLTPIMRAFTYLGNGGILWIGTGILLCFWKRTRKAGVLLLIALTCSFVVNNLILKNLIARARPYDVIGQVLLLIAPQSDFSFPSGHTAASFAAAMVIRKNFPRKYGLIAFAIAAIISFSRLYLGVHYPPGFPAGVRSAGFRHADRTAGIFRRFNCFYEIYSRRAV